MISQLQPFQQLKSEDDFFVFTDQVLGSGQRCQSKVAMKCFQYFSSCAQNLFLL